MIDPARTSAVLALSTVLLVGCETMQANVKLRGEHDLQCADGHVIVMSGAKPGSFVAAGCGRMASYTCVITEETGIPVCQRVATTP